jgi:predicted 3-demethylubiquinone-9 3-methyltransferase (glyoxalase superfamily)
MNEQPVVLLGLGVGMAAGAVIGGAATQSQCGDGGGSLPCVPFTLGGARFQALNGGPQYQLSEPASISVRTADQEETDRLWSALTANGGSEGRCAWLKDRFGMSCR